MVKRARSNLIKVPLSKFVKKAGKEEVIVTIHGRPAAVTIGFEDEDDWLEYRLLKGGKFLARISESRWQYKEAKYKTLEELSLKAD